MVYRLNIYIGMAASVSGLINKDVSTSVVGLTWVVYGGINILHEAINTRKQETEP